SRSVASRSACCSSASTSGRSATSESERSRVGCSSGSASAACCCTSRRSSFSTSPSTRSTLLAPSYSTRRSSSCRAGRSSSRRTTPNASSRSRRSDSCSHEALRGMRYFADVAALARKDLLLELRAKETVPAMLLFVLSTLTVFHFALPRGTGHVAALGLLWVALVFTALLGLTRAFVPEREQGLMDALVLAPCDRSAIWLAKVLAVLA